jgi:hypothetical protein
MPFTVTGPFRLAGAISWYSIQILAEFLKGLDSALNARTRGQDHRDLPHFTVQATHPSVLDGFRAVPVRS